MPFGDAGELIRRLVPGSISSTGVAIGKVIIKTPEGVAPVLESLESLEFLESTPRRFVPVANIDWMGTDFLSCSGATIKFFAQTSTKGITTDGLRYGVGVVLLLFSPVLFGLGFLALETTRKWSCQASQPAYLQPPYIRPVCPALPPRLDAAGSRRSTVRLREAAPRTPTATVR